MDTILYVQPSIQSYCFGYWLSASLLLHWREIAVNRVNIWSHSYSGLYTKQPKDINKPICLLVVKLWLGFGHFISPLPPMRELCSTNLSILSRNYTGSCFLSQQAHTLISWSRRDPLHAIVLFYEHNCNPHQPSFSARWRRREKFVILAFVFAAARL